MPRVVFGRINRRTEQPTLAERTFQQDMQVLARAGALEAAGPDGTEWIAGDLQLDPSGDFLTGILGFVADEKLREYAREVRSWKKGEVRVEVGASRRTLSPFAIDTRSEQRWLGLVPTLRIPPTRFARGFQYLLERAVTSLGLLPAEWEIDLITSTQRIYEWLQDHADIAQLKRIVRIPNPGIDLSGEIEEMRSLAAGKKYETYVPRYNRTLDLERDRELVARLLEGVERGDIAIQIRTREGSAFDSEHDVEQAQVADWDEDWDLATELVLEALRNFLEGREVQQRLPDG